MQIIETGRPLGFTNAPNRANILPGSFDVNWDNYYTGQPVFNIKKFQYPGAWRVGNAAPFYSRLRNPFESTEIVGLTKRFFVGERVNAELRVDFYNVLNRMQVCGADHLKTSSIGKLWNRLSRSRLPGQHTKTGTGFLQDYVLD